MLHRSQHLSEPQSQTLKSSSVVTVKSKELSKSSVSSKCLTNEQNLQSQIVQLKQKAHQSFMQVIQMQQLHEQELQELRTQFCERQNGYQLKVAEAQLKIRQTEELQVRIKQLQYQNTVLQKNSKHHNCDFDQDELQIDNIELITCKQESKLDDSAIINFTEIINISKHEEQIRCIKTEIKKEVEQITRKQFGSYEDSNLGKMIEKIFEYITYIKSEFIKLQEKNIEKEKEVIESTKENQGSKFYDSLQKESKFMTEHIKRLSAQKMKVQKKLLQTQRQVRGLQQKIKKIETSLSKRGIKLEQVVPKNHSPTGLQQLERSLQINQFISQNLKSTNSNPIHKAQYGLISKNKN